MTITLNTKAYEQDASIDANAIQYVGPANTISTNDKLVMKRALTGANADGVKYARATVRFVRTITVDSKQVQATGEAVISVPVGSAKADVDSIRDDLGDLLTSAVGDNLVWKQDITA
jgi:hypothetical protein